MTLEAAHVIKTLSAPILLVAVYFVLFAAVYQEGHFKAALKAVFFQSAYLWLVTIVGFVCTMATTEKKATYLGFPEWVYWLLYVTAAVLVLVGAFFIFKNNVFVPMAGSSAIGEFTIYVLVGGVVLNAIVPAIPALLVGGAVFGLSRFVFGVKVTTELFWLLLVALFFWRQLVIYVNRQIDGAGEVIRRTREWTIFGNDRDFETKIKAQNQLLRQAASIQDAWKIQAAWQKILPPVLCLVLLGAIYLGLRAKSPPTSLWEAIQMSAGLGWLGSDLLLIVSLLRTFNRLAASTQAVMKGFSNYNAEEIRRDMVSRTTRL